MESTMYTVNGREFELKHFGVKGMKWGRRKAKTDYTAQARTARESAAEWDEMAKYAEQRGKTKKAAKYRANAAKDRADASAYERQATPKTSGAPRPSNPKKTRSAGKKSVAKTMKKVGQSTIKGAAKTASYGAQVLARMMQNNVVYGTTGAMFDSMYDRRR